MKGGGHLPAPFFYLRAVLCEMKFPADMGGVSSRTGWNHPKKEAPE